MNLKRLLSLLSMLLYVANIKATLEAFAPVAADISSIVAVLSYS
jgi:hypothetical protein